ncbi:MAG: transcriptional repressor LexA [Candidatus Colwellbacteria bacterium]|nr:transcriptional repressor LexA [Candidatus Colwellbacteria bacterium]
MANNLSEKDKKAFAFIRNKIVHYGESPSLREINEITGGKSPRSASLVVDRLTDAGLLKRVKGQLILIGTLSKASNSTIDVPLVGLVACGTPIFAEENIQTYIPVSTDLAKGGFKYFFLRAVGDSMDRAGINSGDLLLVRQQNDAENGEKVVALINDEATIKILEKTSGAVILKPSSNNKDHQPIVLTDNFMIQGVVVAVLPERLIN